jgi:outer membrane protein
VKNLSLILNVVLGAAVIHLYILQFKNNLPDHGNTEITQEAEDSAGIYQVSETGENALSSSDAKIFYVNTDSLWNNYDLVKKAQDDLKLEKMKLEGQFKSKLDVFEREYMDLQNRANKGLITSDEAQRKETDLMNKQQQLMQLKDDLAMKLMDKEQDMNDKIQKAIYDYLALYQKEKSIDFVLGYTRASGAVLFGNSSLDITDEIIAGLNKTYAAEKPATASAKKK